RNSGEQLLHVGQRAQGNSHLADFAFRFRIVRVDAQLRRQVEGQAQAGLPLLEQILESLIRLARRPEPRVLPHGPELAEIHVLVNSARERILTRRSRNLAHVVRPVDWLDLDPAPRHAHGRNSFFNIASSRVISSTTSPRWFLPRRRNFTTPAWPGLPKTESRGSSSVFDTTVLSANRVSPAK